MTRRLLALGLCLCAAALAGIRPDARAGEAGAAGASTTLRAAGASPFEILRARPVAPSAGRDGVVSVIVRLDVPPLAAYRGGFSGLTATSPSRTGASRLDARSEASRAYLELLDTRLAAFESSLRASVSGAKVVHRYRAVVGGVSVVVPAGGVAALATLPGVAEVIPDRAERLHTSHSPRLVGAADVWEGTAGAGAEGDGVVIGIIDTGVWPEHPSFADPDPLGRPYPEPPPTWSGTACEFSAGANPGPPFSCNNKLVAAYRFLDTFDQVGTPAEGEFTSARDGDGHGTHTATTAAGNAGVDGQTFGVERGTVSGVGARAQVAAYKMCGGIASGCFQSDSVAAVDRAVLDGVDVLNFSIAGGFQAYADIVSRAFLDAYAAGVFVAASAGNDGPSADTVAHRAPWITTVGAAHNVRSFASELTVSLGGDELKVPGTTITTGAGPLPLVFAADGGDNICQSSTPDDLFADKIVMCQRGIIGRTLKGYNVLQRGAAAMILYNSAPNESFAADSHFLPALHVSLESANAISSFVGTSAATATFPAGSEVAADAGVVASFSSRGSRDPGVGVSKPDIVAPGVDILAGTTEQPHGVGLNAHGESFRVMVGTSMASPHVAGAAALVRELHPDWTPGRIRSAMMLNARIGLRAEDGTTPAGPFAAGSGFLDVARAADSPLTIDEDAGVYLARADDLWNANYPSVFVPRIAGSLTVERTVRNELGADTTWKLRVRKPGDLGVAVPRTITVAAGKEETFAIRLRAGRIPLGETRHAVLRLVGPRRLRIPITVVRGEDDTVTLSKSCTPTAFGVGDTAACEITVRNLTIDDTVVRVVDAPSRKLELVSGSVTNAGETETGAVRFDGTLTGGAPAQVSIEDGFAPVGYAPLADFDYEPIPDVGDDDVVVVSTPEFRFGGRTYTRVGMAANGFAIVGGGTGADGTSANQTLPDPAPPNNVIAPLWTDLDPHVGGAMRAGLITSGFRTWQVLDWEGVPDAAGHAQWFQIWIGLGSTEDVTWIYGPVQPGGSFTAGAENENGTSGENLFVTGVGGTIFGEGTEQRVTTVAGTPGESLTIGFDVRGVAEGAFVDCARLASAALEGASAACATGEVEP